MDIEAWAKKHGIRFAQRSYGEYTTDTVSRDALLELARAERAEAAQRVPLTEGQVQDAMRAADWPLSMLSPAIAAKLHQFARAIEAAHGIGAPTATEPKGEQP